MNFRWSSSKAALLAGALAGSSLAGCQENDVQIIWLEAGSQAVDSASGDPAHEAGKDASAPDSSKDAAPDSSKPDSAPDAIADAGADTLHEAAPDPAPDAPADAVEEEAGPGPCAKCVPSRRTNAIMASYETSQGYAQITQRMLLTEGGTLELNLDGTERVYLVSVDSAQRVRLDSTDGIVSLALSGQDELGSTPSMLTKGGVSSPIDLMIPSFSAYDQVGDLIEGIERDESEDANSTGSAELVFTISTASGQNVKKAILHEGEGYMFSEGSDSVTINVRRITDEGVFASFDFSFEGEDVSTGPIYTKEGLYQLLGHHDGEGNWLGLWADVRVSSDTINDGCRAFPYVLTLDGEEHTVLPGSILTVGDAEAGTHEIEVFRHAPDESGSGREAVSVKVDGNFRGVLDLEWDSAIDLGGKELRLKGQSPVQDVCADSASLDIQSKERYASVRDMMRRRFASSSCASAPRPPLRARKGS